MGSVDEDRKEENGTKTKQVSEEDRDEIVRVQKGKQRTALSNVTRRRNEIVSDMANENNLHHVKSGLEKYNDLCVLYQNAFAEHCDVLLSDSEIDKETKRYEERQTSILEFRRQVRDWITRAEAALTEQLDTASVHSNRSQKSRKSRNSRSSAHSKHPSVSVHSHHSKHSNVSASAKEKAKIAELMIDQDVLQQKHQLKIQEDKLRLDAELAKAKARHKIYAEDQQDPMNAYYDKHVTEGTQVPVTSASPTTANVSTRDVSYPETGQQPISTKPRSTVLNHNAPPFAPRTSSQPMYSTSQTPDPMLMTNSLLSALSLPRPEVPKFSGDLTQYRTFINAFDCRVASCSSSSADKLFYLDQHLLGEPKEIVSGCFHLKSDIGYCEARKMLEREYGDPYKISMVYLSKITEWPLVKPGDNVGLKKFSLFLTQCYHAMNCMSYLSVLNHPPNMLSVVQKLPSYLQFKWREHASKKRQTSHLILQFPDLVDFVASAADTANDPVYSTTAMTASNSRPTGNSNKSDHRGKDKQKSHSFATKVATESAKQHCLMCRQQHDIDNCKQFNSKTIDERRAFLKENRLCFGCYGTDHMSKGCTQKRKCKKCQKRHPTALHIDGFQLPRQISSSTVYNNSGHNGQARWISPAANCDSNDSTASAQGNPIDSSIAHNDAPKVCTATDVADLAVVHAILPVQIHQKGSNTVLTTYCFYDNGSSGCFITDDLFSRLNATGVSTSLRLKTMHGCSCVNSTVVNNLVVKDIHGSNPIELPRTYTRDEIPVSLSQIPKADMIQRWHHLRHIATQLPDYQPSLDIGLLVGNNCPAAQEPLEVIPTDGVGPFAARLRHGWTIQGPQRDKRHGNVTCNKIMLQESFKELLTPHSVLRMLELDFNDRNGACYPDERGMSQEDKKFLKMVERETSFSDGHYIVPLPFREEYVMLPCNRSQATKRALWQRTKMLKDDQYRSDYVDFVTKLIDKDYAELVPDEHVIMPPGRVWYLPHHGIYNPNKPGKIRVVFDCSAKFNGTCLNDHLLQGPDLANNLVGVLSRFRQDYVAFMADVEAMFYQVRVPAQQRNFLRFLWWPQGDLHTDVREYQMNVHIFGAVSSPSVANFVLQTVGKRASSPLVSQTILRNFYVDDCLKSVGCISTAKELLQDLMKACSDGGFHLTKVSCNSHDVMQSLPREEYSKEMASRDLDYEDMPVIRALGVEWDVERDKFGFSIKIKEKPFTRRGVLSIVSSVYDPLGFVAPVILSAKKILQDLCREHQVGWDDVIPDEYSSKWHRWLSSLKSLKKLTIERCFVPAAFQTPKDRQLHVFADASSYGYGCAAYLRTTDEDNNCHVAFVAGKARLAPMKATTIPRLELTAAVTAVRLACLIRREIDTDVRMIFHTDATTVLRYIENEHRRFPVFVANRIQLIRDFTEASQWRYVPSALNPADEASRGLSVDDLLTTARWLKGPQFLYMDESQWPSIPPISQDSDKTQSEELVEEETVCSIENQENISTMEYLTSYFSTWKQLRSTVAVYRKLMCILQRRYQIKRNVYVEDPQYTQYLTAQDYENAEIAIVKWIQSQAFPKEIEQLSQRSGEKEGPKWSREKSVAKSSSIYSLNPFMEEGILRVGGRMNRANLPYYTKHPMLLPRKCHLTSLIIRHKHVHLGHAGRNHVLASLRSKYWIIGGNSAVRQSLTSCVTCRRIRGPLQTQKMADLPFCRVDDSLPPFSYTGVDYFGPFLVKEGRKEVKRYGVIFTCLTSRAIHLEVASSLETDSFLNVLRRFVSRRGNVKELRSDNGTNFVGAHKELKKALLEMDQNAIHTWGRHVGFNWIFNPPSASNMGGAWERMIRTVRKVLTGLLQEYGTRLDGDSFHTLLCEAEAIVNSRPITTVSGDPQDPDPLTPNHILTMRSTVTVPPPGVFQKADIYLKRRWRQVQYLASIFWTRWKREYLSLQQQRPKWNQCQRNMKQGDVVLVKDDNAPRNVWPLAVVEETEMDSEGLVRAVKIRTQNIQLRRPINKLVLLVANES